MSTAAPVFVMNVYYTGIGIARNLRGAVADVYGLSSERDAPGLRSRHFRSVVMVPNGRDHPQALYERLVALRNQHREAPVIFPTRDADVLFLRDYAHRLGALYRLPPSLGTLDGIMDKLALATVAAREQIPVPKTRACGNEADVEQAARALAFPLVMKPRSAHEWRRQGVWEKVGARKAIIARSVDELRSEYRALADVSPNVLLQEFVAGDDSDIVVFCSYQAQSGESLGYFTGRKLRQSPPLFGTGCLVEATPVPEIVEPAQRLLRACGYSGLAEVEFKYDRSSGKFMLIEINPRHWDQHELGRLVGVNMSCIAYRDAVGVKQAGVHPRYAIESRPRWIAEREALRQIARNVVRDSAARAAGKGPSSINVVRKVIAELRYLFRRPRIFSILSARDPLPGVLLCARLGREAVAMAMSQWGKRDA